jgi:hypothetical protein
MAEGYEFHEDLLPISLLITKRTLVTNDVEGVFDYYRGLCRRGIKFVAISDVRAARSMPDAKTRQRFGEGARRFSHESKLWSLGSGVILESNLIRGALIAIDWIARPETPTAYFESLRDSIDWAISKLEMAHIPITPAIRDFRRTVPPSPPA